MSEKNIKNISSNKLIPVATNHYSAKIILVCRNCNAVFERNASVSPAHNEYYRCNRCRGIQSMDFISLCIIQ